MLAAVDSTPPRLLRPGSGKGMRKLILAAATLLIHVRSAEAETRTSREMFALEPLRVALECGSESDE